MATVRDRTRSAHPQGRPPVVMSRSARCHAVYSWEGFLVQHNGGRMDGFLQRPTPPANNPGVKLAAANTFPIGYYTNRHRDGRHKEAPDLPVIGALAEHYTVLDRLVRRRDLPQPVLPARRADRPGPQLRYAVHAAIHLGSAIAGPEHPGHPDGRLLLPGPAVPRSVGPEAPPVLAPVRQRRRRRTRHPGSHAVVPGHRGRRQPAEHQLHRPGV
jgi:hypothetical protein